MKPEIDNFPYVFRFKLDGITNHQEKITQYALSQFDAKLDTSSGFNVQLDAAPELEELWDTFVEVCNASFYYLRVIMHFPKFKTYWAYVSHKEKFSTVWNSPSIWNHSNRLSQLDESGRRLRRA